MGNLTCVMLGPKYSAFKDKYGKLHVSKEKLYVLLATFMVPKGSFLNASETTVFNICVPDRFSFQRAFNVAISSLLENGIYQKITRDITTSKAHRGYFHEFWTPEQLRSNKPFTFHHAMPAFIALGLGLIPATLILLLELVLHLCKKYRTSKASRHLGLN